MINLENNLIERNGKSYPIESWVTWWSGPAGLYTTLPEAVAAARHYDLEPNLMTRGVTVAIAEAGNVYEVQM